MYKHLHCPQSAEEAAAIPSPTTPGKAVQTAAKAGHPKVVADIAFQAVSSVEDAPVQVDRPVLGVLPPHATQGYTSLPLIYLYLL